MKGVKASFVTLFEFSLFLRFDVLSFALFACRKYRVIINFRFVYAHTHIHIFVWYMFMGLSLQ